VNQNGIRPLRPLQIATAPYHDLATTALAGSLMYEGDCLLFRSERNGMLLMPVWPSGSSFNGTAVLFHQPGRADQRLMITEEFLMEGQPLQWSALSAPEYLGFQRQCNYPPFFVTSLRPAN
jgi:hypothetical protein